MSVIAASERRPRVPMKLSLKYALSLRLQRVMQP
ncbi:hypothetical protein GQ600_8604 [Phytophthora cactorum]|nr:hypothetical protein GQ600_8604 [Phytophthora cactorum]